MTTETGLNLREFPFPKLDGVDVHFSNLGTDPALLDEAKRRGFLYGRTPYNQLFSDLFFSGGKLEWKKDLPPDFKENAGRYLRSFMGSFRPKHEHKEAICALLLSELVEAPKKPR